MTDQELLERAARAAGYKFDGNLKHDRYSSNIWDALNDDADALRLLADLNMSADVRDDLVVVTSPDHDEICEPINNNAHAAFRRAVCRVAAAMAS